MSTPVTIRRLRRADLSMMRQLNAVFGEAFDDPDAYAAAPPENSYLEALLGKEHVVALVALTGTEGLGGLVAYEREKFEQARREIYIYDLAVRHPASSAGARDGPHRSVARNRREP